MDKETLIKRLKENGFSDRVIDAFGKIRREDFVPEELRKIAYYDQALPIGSGTTISQPYTIAFMLDLLDLEDNLKMLEIGSGSGYVLALIGEMSEGSEIYGLEIIKEHAERSRERIDKENIDIRNMNGRDGLKEKAPFDRILASASYDEVPEHLFSQLSENGILVVPVGNSIFRFRKDGLKISEEEFPGFIFVPVIE